MCVELTSSNQRGSSKVRISHDSDCTRDEAKVWLYVLPSTTQRTEKIQIIRADFVIVFMQILTETMIFLERDKGNQFEP
jgi:hypothetical protein